MPCPDRWSCKDMPLISGICTSHIRQRASATAVDWRNDAADANVHAENPSDRTSSWRDARDKSSSSTIDISGISVKEQFHFGSMIGARGSPEVCENGTERLPSKLGPKCYMFGTTGALFIAAFSLHISRKGDAIRTCSRKELLRDQ
jgi:hypothetical protein